MRARDRLREQRLWATFKGRKQAVSYPRRIGRRADALRSIRIGDGIFRWRFRPGAKESALVLHGSISSGQPLSVILGGWRDPWLNISGFRFDEGGDMLLETRAPNEPAIVTPKFVRLAILHALASGWRPLERGPRVYCLYSGGKFSALSARREALAVFPSSQPRLQRPMVVMHARRVY
jgi:hypothetical protein